MQKRYPFKFLDAYTRADNDLFFGRSEEVAQLYEMVFQTDLLLVYGASGTGKTSLIQCGLASKFQSHDWLALNIRRGDNLNESLDQALKTSGGDSEQPADDLNWLDDDLSAADDSPQQSAPPSTLARRLKAVYLRHFKPLYLIFDQFEELYILGDKTEEQTFIETVREILRADQPIKIILSIREEYLGHLYAFEREVPELLRKKLRVEPMTLDRVASVLQGISDSPQSNVQLRAGEEAALTQGIFEKIRGEEKTLGIPLPYLQVFLDKLYFQTTQDKNRQAEAIFTLEGLKKIGDIGNVLRNFLDDQVPRIATQLGCPPEVIWKTLSPFVTLDGTKEPLTVEMLKERLPDAAPDFASRSIEAFQQGRILRLDERTQRYEVAHDSLARQIHAKRSDEEIAILEVRRMVKSQAALQEEAREFFTEKQLLFIEPYLSKFKPSEEELHWIEKSRAFRNAEKKAEAEREKLALEQALQQAEQERELREQAELAKTEAEKAKEDAESQRSIALENEKKAQNNEQRARQRTRLAGIISVIALVLALFAAYSYWQAGMSADLAVAEEQKAKEALVQVEKEKAATDEQRKKAEVNFKLAEVKTKEAEKNFKLAKANLKKAETEQAKAKAALLQVEKEKAATDEQRKLAEENFELAEQKTQETENQRNEAQTALAELEEKNAAVVRLVLNNARRDVLNLRYEEALEKIKAAAGIDALKPEVAHALLEMAFWHGETGNTQRATALLDSIADLTNNKTLPSLLKNLPDEPTAARQRLRDAMKAVDVSHFRFLFEEKYYPATVPVEGRTFNMGCDPGEDCEDLHPQTVSSFQMATTETTVWQFALYCAATPDLAIEDFLESTWSDPGNNPVVNVNWAHAVNYANWVSRQLGETEAIGKDSEGRNTVNLRAGYRLPTEAEWEYAAKEGANLSPFVYSGHNEIDSVAWYDENSNGRTQTVGTKKANALGLYDMSGNVWEWCWDYYGDYVSAPGKDYKGPPEGSYRVIRGGGWFSLAQSCRTAHRFNDSPDYRYNYLGFRLVFVP